MRKQMFIVLGAGVLCAAVGCHKPTVWTYTGPRVYLIQGSGNDGTTSFYQLRDELERREINAAVYSPDDWLKVVVDIDKDPDEDAILVGHGHGAFLCTQVVRHYAQDHKTKHIKAVLSVDPYNKDWPHKWESYHGSNPRIAPEAIPLGHNANMAWNYRQTNSQSEVWGSDLVSTRDSNIREEHPYYWYDHYWYDRPITGQALRDDMTQVGVTHESIDNYPQLVERIVSLCRQQALNPFHYTPVRHHPYATQAGVVPAQPSGTSPLQPG